MVNFISIHSNLLVFILDFEVHDQWHQPRFLNLLYSWIEVGVCVSTSSVSCVTAHVTGTWNNKVAKQVLYSFPIFSIIDGRGLNNKTGLAKKGKANTLLFCSRTACTLIARWNALVLKVMWAGTQRTLKKAKFWLQMRISA